MKRNQPLTLYTYLTFFISRIPYKSHEKQSSQQLYDFKALIWSVLAVVKSDYCEYIPFQTEERSI